MTQSAHFVIGDWGRDIRYWGLGNITPSPHHLVILSSSPQSPVLGTGWASVSLAMLARKICNPTNAASM